MRYRNQSKIKRKHHLIDNLDKFLVDIESWKEITAINPGVIKPCSHNDKFIFVLRYEMPTGIKCYAKNCGAVQEVFIVSSNTSKLIQKLQAYLIKFN
jgi:hypothetical protein